MQCVITTPTNTETHADLTNVILPTESGRAQIRPGHAEYFANLTAGKLLCINKAEETTEIIIAEGICHVLNDVVTVVI
jgi:F0F1-type ATP synthase epsilon subunit